MTKVKEKLYEHRFGMFFFVVLIGYNVIANSMQWGEITDITYSYHIVDFSIGFCSKLLPGAICNFFLGEVTWEKLQIYLSILMVLCFILVAVLLEKTVLSEKKENRMQILIVIMFLLTGACTFSFHFEYLVWFDFYWLYFSVLCFFVLMKKQTYALVIPLMIGAIMCHYAAIICYVPFIAIIMLYKISQTGKKSEKIYLSVIWTVLVVTCVGLSIYLIANETKNVKMTLDEMNQFLSSRGVTEESLEYYDFAFFRDEVIDKINMSDTDSYVENIKDIDTEKSDITIFLQMFIQQILVTMTLSDLRLSFEYILLLLPLIVIIYRLLLFDFSLEKKNKLKRFSIICAMFLFWVTLLFGKMLSTDTVRWFSNALIPLMGFFLYVIYNSGSEPRHFMRDYLSKIPGIFIGLYYVIYFLSAI